MRFGFSLIVLRWLKRRRSPPISANMQQPLSAPSIGTMKPLTPPRRRRVRGAATLPVQLAELAVAAPQVIAHRVTRMAIAGHQPSARDRKEFTGMVAEKQLAFSQALTVLATESVKAQVRLSTEWLKLLTPGGLTPARAARLARETNASALAVASKAIAPVHRKATANAKRLAKTKLR